jgi:TPR repeat protein
MVLFGALLGSVASGSAVARWEEGNAALSEGNSDTAVELFRQAARTGDVRAQYSLAVQLLRGEGVAYNAEKAARWLRRAVDADYPRAHVLLGNLYAGGEGVEHDDARAVSLYRFAAERGVAKAQVAMAIMLHAGRGAKRDDEAAFMWLLLARDQGENSAKEPLELLAKKLGEGQQSRAFERAMRWTPAVAEREESRR